jgi:hypothetical protein
MAQSGVPGINATPALYDIEIGTGSASGNVSVGDYLAYSGQTIFATNAGHTAYWKQSGAGVALESNSAYDNFGRAVANTALRFVRQGVIRVSGAASGVIALGQGAYPVSTGSAVAGVTGQTGVGATWQTGAKLPLSLTGNTGAGGSGIATVIGVNMTNAVAGTGQWDVLLLPIRPDFY